MQPERKGLAPKSIRGLHIAIHGGFERAIKLNLLGRNPAALVELPRAPRRRVLPVDVADVIRLLHTSQESGDRFAALWVFLANTGLRIGEALAIQWDDVDLDGGWCVVARNLGRDGRVDTTKTESGERTIPLTMPLVAVLRTHRDRQLFERRPLGTDYESRGLVFATSVGTPFSQRNVLRALKLAARSADVSESLCLHDLRRLAASLLVTSGVDVVTAAAILGHKNASILLDVYAQAQKEGKINARERMERALYGSAGT